MLENIQPTEEKSALAKARENAESAIDSIASRWAASEQSRESTGASAADAMVATYSKAIEGIASSNGLDLGEELRRAGEKYGFAFPGATPEVSNEAPAIDAHAHAAKELDRNARLKAAREEISQLHNAAHVDESTTLDLQSFDPSLENPHKPDVLHFANQHQRTEWMKANASHISKEDVNGNQYLDLNTIPHDTEEVAMEAPKPAQTKTSFWDKAKSRVRKAFSIFAIGTAGVAGSSGDAATPGTLPFKLSPLDYEVQNHHTTHPQSDLKVRTQKQADAETFARAHSARLAATPEAGHVAAENHPVADSAQHAPAETAPLEAPVATRRFESDSSIKKDMPRRQYSVSVRNFDPTLKTRGAAKLVTFKTEKEREAWVKANAGHLQRLDTLEYLDTNTVHSGGEEGIVKK